MIEWDTQSISNHARSVAALAAGPARVRALAVAQEAVLVQAVVLAQDLVQVAAVEAAAEAAVAQERDQGPEAVRDLEQA